VYISHIYHVIEHFFFLHYTQVSIGPFPNTKHGADHTENTSNTFSIVACPYFTRCLEMGQNVAIFTYKDFTIGFINLFQSA
jgi:hypothetical protein